ncbi:MAG: efflux transporter outer membrane subunit [Planctomycetota bacterium]
MGARERRGSARRLKPAPTDPILSRLLSQGVVVLCSLLIGCTVGPNYTPPDAPTAENWIEAGAPNIKREAADHAEWWTVFSDPILDRLVRTAYSQNLSLRTAGLRVLEARAFRGVAVGDFFPQVQEGVGSYTRAETSGALANSPRRRRSSDFAFGGNVSWELDFWGRFRRGIEAADASLYASVLNYDDVLVTLVADVASAYVNIRAYDERLALARSNVTLQRQSFNIADARFRAGGTTELDVEQAKSLLADTQAMIPELEIGRRQAANQLCILLGTPPRQLDDLLGEAKPIPTAPPSVAIGIPAELLRRRPDIRRAERNAATECARIGVTKADLYPTFSLAGSFGWEAQHFSWLFDGHAFNGSVGPSVRWDLFNYGRIKNNIRLQDARFEEAMTTYQNTVLQAGQEVEDAIVAYLRSQEQANFLTESVTAARKSVDLAMIQYQAGGADYTRVLNTQTALVQGQDDLVVSHGNIALSLVSLHRALGGGWQIRYGKEFVPAETLKRMRARTDWGNLIDPNYGAKSDMLLFKRPDTDKDPVPPGQLEKPDQPGAADKSAKPAK